MRKGITAMGVVAAVLASAPAAYACDMDGFGMGRFNPFGHQASWGVPSDAPKPQQSENSAILGAQAQKSASTTDQQNSASRTQAEQKTADAAPRTFAASTDAPADQAKRFTATKD